MKELVLLPEAQHAADKPIGFVSQFARKLLCRQLSQLRIGQVRLIDKSGAQTFGEAGPEEMQATVTVHDPRFYRRIVWGGSVALGESYVDGDWSCDNLTMLVRIFVRNMPLSIEMERSVPWLRQVPSRIFHWLKRNTQRGSQRNIGAHYDLGNDFFALFLDETMTYSCGIFERREASLQEASLAKIERICRKLQLRAEDHVLEIGTGWGGFAIHAARSYGCRVTTTTISRQQYDLASARVHEAGLGDRVTVLLQDYRELRGRYNKLVSIEMVEAVGHEFLDAYFRKCSELLEPGGIMALQGIVLCEQGHEAYLRTPDFIQKHVFPGGCLPSIASLTRAAARMTDMRLLHLEDLAPHYAETLRRWRRRFFERIEDVRKLGYPERFQRLWEYYLCYCEAAFDERYCGTVQMVFAKSACRHDPLTPSLPAIATWT